MVAINCSVAPGMPIGREIDMVVKMLEVNLLSRCTVFFGSYDHLTARGGWGDNRDRFYCPLCDIGGRCCFDLDFPV